MKHEQSDSVLPSAMQALAAYYSRVESAQSEGNEPPAPPVEVEHLLRMMLPTQIGDISQRLASMTHRHPGVIAHWLAGILAKQRGLLPDRPDDDAKIMPPTVAAAEAVRTIAVLADRLATWAGSDAETMTVDDRSALNLARLYGWRPRGRAPE